MLDCKHAYDVLAANGVTLYAGVPDSLLKSFCAYVADHTKPARNIITANEGGAVALAVGHYLATSEIGLVYLQNSGLGNTVNPLTSLADPDVYGVPLLLMIGWRGEPGRKDEPQHVKMGKITLGALENLGIPHEVLPVDDAAAAAAITTAVAHAKENRTPYALVVRKGTFAEYELQRDDPAPYPMAREDALALILDALEPGTPVVSTTGMASREVFELRKKRGESHDSDFLTVGSMGHCSQIALGAALCRPGRDLLCIDGDGATLMHLGGLTTIGQVATANFKHVVINNGAHDSVGGQPTVGFDIDLCAIAKACGYRAALRADDAESLKARLPELVVARGPALLEVRVHKGARPDLGRPTNPPGFTKQQFMEFLRR